MFNHLTHLNWAISLPLPPLCVPSAFVSSGLLAGCDLLGGENWFIYIEHYLAQSRCSMKFLTAWDLGGALKYSLLGGLQGRPLKEGLLITHTPCTLTTSRNNHFFLTSWDVLQYLGTSMFFEYSITHSTLIQCNSSLWNSYFISMYWKVSSVVAPPPPPALLTLRGTPGCPWTPDPCLRNPR